MSSIAMWGAPGSGKTTFLAALSVALGQQASDGDGWILSGVDPGSERRLITMSSDLQKHKFPNATQSTERLQWKLSKRVTSVTKKPFRKPVAQYRKVSVDLDLIDSSGELVSDANYDSPDRNDLVERLRSSRGIVYVFDPIREAVTGDAYWHTFGLCAELARIFDQDPAFDGKLPHHVAVCVTKFDQLPVFEAARRKRLLTVDPDDPYGIPRVPDDDARALFEILLEVSGSGVGESVLNTLERYFDRDRIEYFVTSAVGFYIDPRTRRFDPEDPQNLLPDGDATHQDRVRGAVRPINVVEPVLWLSEQVAQRTGAAPPVPPASAVPASPAQPPYAQAGPYGATGPYSGTGLFGDRPTLGRSLRAGAVPGRAGPRAAAPDGGAVSGVPVVRSVSVPTEWALYGKNPGDYEGYRILECSEGPVKWASFREAIGRYDLGTPEELPQVAISYLRSAGQSGSYLALAVAEYRDSHRDATGRAIAYTRYFCVPYRDLAAEGVGYLAMYQAFQGVGLPQPSGAPLLAQVASLPLPAQFEGDLAVRVAAQLLTGRNVCVVGAARVSVVDRLRFIDGVMALLPYGMRAKMTAATWTRSTSQHRFRLFFSDSPRAAIDGREPDLMATWDRPDQTAIPHEYPYAWEYLGWLGNAMRSPAEMLADLTDETGFSSASVLRMLEKVGVNVPGRGSPPGPPPPASPHPSPPADNPLQYDHAARILDAINGRVNSGDLRGLRADLTALRTQVKRQMESGKYLSSGRRKEYRDFIFRNQLLRPQLQEQLGRDTGTYNRALLALAFEAPLSYEGYCQLEDCLGTGSPPDPSPSAALLDEICRPGMPDIRVAVLVLSYLGEDRQREWFRSARVSLDSMVGHLVGPWDREHHRVLMCDALEWYLRVMPGKHKPADVRAALEPHDYLVPVLQARYGSVPQFQYKVLRTLLVAAFGQHLGRGPVTDVLRRGSHPPTWPLLGAVLTLLDQADPDLPALAIESFLAGGVENSGFEPDLMRSLLRQVAPDIAAGHEIAADPDATRPIDPRLAAGGRRPVGALPAGHAAAPVPPAPAYDPMASQPSFEPAQSQPGSQPEEPAAKGWGGRLGGSFRR